MMCYYLNVQFQGQRVKGRPFDSVKLVNSESSKWK